METVPPVILSGRANEPLARAIARVLQVEPAPRTLESFPDGELNVELAAPVRGRDVYLVQPTSPPVAEHLLELLLLADAAGRAGAARITAVVPYFGYARQDRRARGREPVGARLVSDLLGAAPIARLVCVDLHTPAIEGFFATPAEHLTAVPTLADALAGLVGADGVVVAPDLGAVKLAERYAARLRLPTAVVHKWRRSGTDVEVRGIVGEVRGLRPVIVDDMIGTGGTVEAAGKALLAAGCVPELVVAASHLLLVGPAEARLRSLPLRALLGTDSVAPLGASALPIRRVGLAPVLAETIAKLHGGGVSASPA
jgi:ribose-phosphate pyrophosphokinase